MTLRNGLSTVAFGGAFVAGVAAIGYCAGHAVKRAVYNVVAPGAPIDDEGDEKTLLCPRLLLPVPRSRGPDATIYNVDDETWATDYRCPCGDTHRFYHDGESEPRYERDVPAPGERTP